MADAEGLHRRGVAAYNRGRHADARRLLEGGLALASTDDLSARIEVSLAYVLSETGSPTEALALCAQALARPGTSRATRGVLHGQAGLLHMLRGEGDEALASFERAVGLLEDPQELSRVHLNRGGVHLQRLQLAHAAASFESAQAAYLASGDAFGAAKAVHNLGYVHLLSGNLVAALERMREAHEPVASQGPVMRAMVEQDRAEALIAAGLVKEGVEALRAASAAYARRRLYQRQGEAELARARYEGDPREARAAARRATQRFELSGSSSWAARARAEELSADVALGRASDATARGDQVVEELTRHRLRWPAVAVRLTVVRALLEAGRVAEARRRLSAVRTSPATPLAVRLTERDVRAAAAARPAQALAHVRAGLDDLHAWQSSFGSLDLQTNVVGHGVRLGLRGLSLAVGSRSDAVLLEWSERARMLASRVQPVRVPQDPGTVADLTELRSEPAPEREAVLRRRIRERAWQRRGSGAFDEPATLLAVQAGLQTATALVAYIVTAHQVVALVVTDGGTRRCELATRTRLDQLLGGLLPDLDMAGTDLPERLAGSVRATLAARLEVLADLLVAPLLDAVGDRAVVMTPSGVLAGVPWTLLPGLAGRPVTVAQSATSWLARRATPLRLGSAGFVAGPRVPRAEDEVRAAAAVWPSASVLVGPAATADEVSALAGRVDVLHVAAHGRHAADNPLFSGLELADGTWFGYDVDQLPGVPDVVLLSACEVGRSSVRWGEELIGMTAAWLHAGARCVVASPAAVNDAVAHDVLVAVHAGLADGLDPATALARAVCKVTTDAAPAPFSCFG